MHIVELNHFEKSNVTGGMAEGMAEFGGFMFSLAATSFALFILGGGIAQIAKKIDGYQELGRVQRGREILRVLGLKKIAITSAIFAAVNFVSSHIAQAIVSDSDED